MLLANLGAHCLKTKNFQNPTNKMKGILIGVRKSKQKDLNIFQITFYSKTNFSKVIHTFRCPLT